MTTFQGLDHNPTLDQLVSGDQEDDDFDVLLSPCRVTQEPLNNLENLTLWDVTEGTSTSEILSVFAHCPNIRKHNITSVCGDHEIDVIGEYIGKECPKIQSLKYYSMRFNEHDILPSRIIDALPPQQLESLECRGYWPTLDDLSDNLTRLQRHSLSLRRIVIECPRIIGLISLAIILRECKHLDELNIECQDHKGSYVDLEEATDHPSGCIKVTWLTLEIGRCDLPDNPGAPPYYTRPNPLILSDVEVQHLAKLETL